MKLYKATYKPISWSDPGLSSAIIQYILAPDFQAAAKLAETREKITNKSGGSGNPIIGDMSNTLSNLEEIAFEVSDFHNTAKLYNIGSHMFSIVDNKLLKVELLAVKVIQE